MYIGAIVQNDEIVGHDGFEDCTECMLLDQFSGKANQDGNREGVVNRGGRNPLGLLRPALMPSMDGDGPCRPSLASSCWW